MGRYRWSSHQGYLGRKKGPEWFNTEELLSWFRRGSRGVREYQEHMHGQIEEEVEELKQLLTKYEREKDSLRIARCQLKAMTDRYNQCQERTNRLSARFVELRRGLTLPIEDIQ